MRCRPPGGRGRRSIAVVMAVAGLALTACGTTPHAGSRPSTPGRAGGATTTSAPAGGHFASPSEVAAAVRAGQAVTRLPSTAVTDVELLAVDKLSTGYVSDEVTTRCPPLTEAQSRVDVADCTFGDRAATQTAVLLGDSRAQMWFETINEIASAEHWKLIVLTKVACPAAVGSFRAITPGGVATHAPSPACDDWHRFVVRTVKEIDPSVIIDSSAPNLYLEGDEGFASPAQTQTAFTGFLRELPTGSTKVLLGGFPNPSPSPVLCLSKNPTAVQHCAYRPAPFQLALNAAARRAAAQTGVGYINESPWLCAGSCPAVINGLVPYTLDGFHIQSEYATYLTGVMKAALKPYLAP